jgi:Fur family transcriptional regulator, iron response regulator
LRSSRKRAYNNFSCNNLALAPPGANLIQVPLMTSPRASAPAAKAPAAPATGDMTGCPWHDVKAKLREVGLRPTRQRMALGWILFAKGDRHITAEMLYEEANRAKVPVSLATVYNTLHQFTDVGLLRQVAVDGSKAYFDTNNTEHHHFFIEDRNDLMDIPSSDVVVGKAPVPPEGYEIARIDVVVRLRKKKR